MEKITKEGKELETVLASILEENNLTKEEVIYTYQEKKGKLFQGSLIEVTVYPKKNILDEIKVYLTNVLKYMDLEVNFEVSNNEDRTTIKMYSNNNPILIGKNGQTIKALEVLIRQMLQAKYGINYKVSLDVENYKAKKERNLERMAKQIAKEVVDTKMEVKLDNMSSYERRIIHNVLTNFKGVKTESEGEEPNRHVVIKPE